LPSDSTLLDHGVTVVSSHQGILATTNWLIDCHSPYDIRSDEIHREIRLCSGPCKSSQSCRFPLRLLSRSANSQHPHARDEFTYVESTNSSLFAHRSSFDYGFGTELVPTNTCVSSNLVNHNVQFKIDGVKQIWGRFFLNDYNSIFCVMGYSGAECLCQELQFLYNWTSSSTCTSCG